MTKTAFLSIALRQRPHLNAEVELIASVLRERGFALIDFTTEFRFEEGHERAMMQVVREKITAADLLIAEVSEKAIGVGIEIGFAAALGKPILYLRRSGAEYSTTVGGLATASIMYDDLDDLRQKLWTQTFF